ncbi:MAG: glycosyltransferase 87 family protein, partial [Bacteroidota bacterium]|nr:glycosyltransferase 87 family protein [Bacteroidota bacterium]
SKGCALRGYLAAVPRYFLLFLALLALFNGSRVFREPRPNADRPMDFRTCYVGQAVLRQGLNPYDDAALKAGWRQLVAHEHLFSRTQPGLPNLPFLYPPWAAALFGLSIGRLPYALAAPLWYALALLFLGMLARLWPAVLRAETGPEVPWWQYLLFTLALKGTVPALLAGQPTFAALALGVGAMALGRPGQKAATTDTLKAEAAAEASAAVATFGTPTTAATAADVRAATAPAAAPAAQAARPPVSLVRLLLAGLLLGLAAFKVTLLLPFAAWFLWRRQWLALAVAAGVVALLSAVAWHWAAFPADLLPTYQQLLAQVRAQSFDPADPDYPLTQGMTLRLELGNVLEWLRPGSRDWHPWLHAALWLAALARLAWLRRRGQRLAGWYVFLVLATLTLLTTYHLYYDAVLLLPLLAFGQRLTPRRQLLLAALLLPLLLPLNGVALALGNPVALRWLYFLPPLGLLGVLALLLARPVGPGQQGRHAELVEASLPRK